MAGDLAFVVKVSPIAELAWGILWQDGLSVVDSYLLVDLFTANL